MLRQSGGGVQGPRQEEDPASRYPDAESLRDSWSERAAVAADPASRYPDAESLRDALAACAAASDWGPREATQGWQAIRA